MELAQRSQVVRGSRCLLAATNSRKLRAIRSEAQTPLILRRRQPSRPYVANNFAVVVTNSGTGGLGYQTSRTCGRRDGKGSVDFVFPFPTVALEDKFHID